MQDYNLNDTISAISTPLGEGAIAIVRMSGKGSLDIANKIFTKNLKNYKSHTAHFGQITYENNIIDDVLVLIMLSPNSYTCEDIVEIHCHGGKLITKKVYETTLKAGARSASPGEFTFRAFINGKIDLTKAEAVQDMIKAKNDYAYEAAKANLEGKLFDKIIFFQKELVDMAAILEALVDFPEEGLEYISEKELLLKLEGILNEMKKLFKTFENGKLISEAITLCIFGPPNVGKSSLLNALLKKDRAIVTDIPGTTRDLIEEDLFFNNLNFKIIDTAGIRSTTCLIEEEGIKRSKTMSEKADIKLLVLDASGELNDNDKHLLKNIDEKNTILVWNKIDIKKSDIFLDFPNQVFISAKNGENLDSLTDIIEKLIFKNKMPDKNELVITKKRHKDALEEAVKHLKEVIEGIKNKESLELVSFDMKSALSSLEKIIGFDITEDILSSIFKNFCIGK